MAFTFAANLSLLFTEVPFLDRFEAAARAGFRAVEVLYPYDVDPIEIRKRLDDQGLRMALFNLAPGDLRAGERGIACLPSRREAFRSAVCVALEYADALDCERMHCMAGVRPAHVGEDLLEGQYHENLAFAAEACRSAGRLLTIEPINRRDIPGYFLNTTSAARQTITAVGAPNLRLQLDLYHCQITEGDLARRIIECADVVAHVQIAGAPDRHEPDVGEINYPYLFDQLARSGYSGFVGCEYRPRGRTQDGLAWLAQAQPLWEARTNTAIPLTGSSHG